MKMIISIINKKDADEVCSSLKDAGYFFTKMATTGGFLTAGNTTLLIGIDDDKVEDAIGIIRRHCSRRTETVLAAHHPGTAPIAYPTQVSVGGATVFVTDVEHFEKM